jgi:hypothetical protein
MSAAASVKTRVAGAWLAASQASAVRVGGSPATGTLAMAGWAW